jgi:hypothetical protein
VFDIINTNHPIPTMSATRVLASWSRPETPKPKPPALKFGEFECDGTGLSFKSHHRESLMYIERRLGLREWEPINVDTFDHSPRAQKPWWEAQLRLYGLECKNSWSIERMREVFEQAIHEGLSIPQELQNEEERLIREYREKEKELEQHQWVADVLSKSLANVRWRMAKRMEKEVKREPLQERSLNRRAADLMDIVCEGKSADDILQIESVAKLVVLDEHHARMLAAAKLPHEQRESIENAVAAQGPRKERPVNQDPDAIHAPYCHEKLTGDDLIEKMILLDKHREEILAGLPIKQHESVLDAVVAHLKAGEEEEKECHKKREEERRARDQLVEDIRARHIRSMTRLHDYLLTYELDGGADIRGRWLMDCPELTYGFCSNDIWRDKVVMWDIHRPQEGENCRWVIFEQIIFEGILCIETPKHDSWKREKKLRFTWRGQETGEPDLQFDDELNSGWIIFTSSHECKGSFGSMSGGPYEFTGKKTSPVVPGKWPKTLKKEYENYERRFEKESFWI